MDDRSPRRGGNGAGERQILTTPPPPNGLGVERWVQSTAGGKPSRYSHDGVTCPPPKLCNLLTHLCVCPLLTPPPRQKKESCLRKRGEPSPTQAKVQDEANGTIATPSEAIHTALSRT